MEWTIILSNTYLLYIFLFTRFISLLTHWHCVSSFWNYQNGRENSFKITCFNYATKLFVMTICLLWLFFSTRTKMTLKRSLMKNVPAIIPELVLEVDEPDWNGTTIFRAYLNQRGFKFTKGWKKVTHIKTKQNPLYLLLETWYYTIDV